ncbi:aldehyde dehydrogenase family protein [Fulvivirga sp. M361]|nr:aldehyde dehydrogenase family protein [Fulvivirga sp. M361]
MTGSASSAQRIQRIFDMQQKHAIQLRTERIQERIKQLKKLKSWIDKNDFLIKKAIYDDFRKPEAEVDMSDIYPVLTELKDAIRNIKRWSSVTPVDGSVAYLTTSAQVEYEPKGVCLIMAPWNFPFNLTIGPLVSALAAGNTVMIKPSEMTPNTSALIDDMVGELFREEEVAVFNGEAEVAKTLLELPFDHIFFTGSPAIGKLIMKAAAEHLTSVTLELGGKSPAVIDENVNIRDAARKIAWGKFLNNGQTCVAPDYVLVHTQVKDQFLDALSVQVSSLFGGNEGLIGASPDYARLVNRRHFSRISSLMEEALQKGAKVRFGNHKDEADHFISPTVLTDVSLDMQVMEEEIFGPVLPVITYNDLHEAISIINKKPKPLALYYFGKSKKRRRQLVSSTSSGTVCINDCVIQYSHPHLPFGGVNNSGLGKAHGRYGFLAFSNEKAVLKQRIGFTSSRFIYPPYTKSVRLILKLLKKYF